MSYRTSRRRVTRRYKGGSRAHFAAFLAGRSRVIRTFDGYLAYSSDGDRYTVVAQAKDQTGQWVPVSQPQEAPL